MNIETLEVDEAAASLQWLLTASRALSGAVGEIGPALADLARACVPAVCDLCVVELVDPSGRPEVAVYKAAGGMIRDRPWHPRGHQFFALRRVALHAAGSAGADGYPGPELRHLRHTLGAGSVLVAPVVNAGVVLGWMYCATAPGRPPLRPAALPVTEEISRQIGITAQRILLHHDRVASAEAQQQTIRQLRRLAAAAANLAGAETAADVLRTACVEVCLVLDADAAVAQWRLADGRLVEASAGAVEDGSTVAARALERRSVRQEGWLAVPLPCADPAHRASLAVRATLSAGAEVVLDSFAALVPVAFERALTTDAARRQKEHLQAVLDASPVALFTATGDGAIAEANTAAAALFGWERAEDRRRFPPAIGPVMSKLVADTCAGRPVEGVPVSTEDLDVSVSASPLPPAVGAAVIVAVTDLREQRAAQRALFQAQRLEAMGQVAGGLSHDFNNLMAVILAAASSLHAHPGEEERRHSLDAIDRAAARAGELTRRLLSFTRRSADEAPCADLAGEVRSLAPLVERIVGRDVRVEWSAPTGPMAVAATSSEVEQIILNLAINANDAMAGQGALRVSADTVDLDAGGAARRGVGAGAYCRLSVVDDGPGMDEATKLRCLEPFFTTKPVGQGSGLGLSTVYAVVSERRGHVLVESEIGRGTAITVLLPVASGAEAPPSPAVDPGAAVPAGTTVLVVEADGDLRTLAARVLADAGADVVVARTGAEAIRLAREIERVDVLVTGAVLPDSAGIDVAATVQARNPGVKVLLVSGYAARNLAYPAGVGLLRRPYHPAELVGSVNRMLGEGTPQGS